MIYIDSMLETELDGQLLYHMKKVAQSTIAGEKIANCGVCITVVSSEEIRRLNSEFRSKDAVTDVLSLPANEVTKPLVKAIAEGFEPETEDGEVYLGDIAICMDRAREQAVQYDNTLEEEMCFLTAHGLLHLLGYNHENHDDEMIMRTKQRIALGRSAS